MRSAITIVTPNAVNEDTDRAALWPGWYKILIFVAIAPLLHALATWDIDGKLTSITQWFRLYSLPIVLLELFVLLMALDQGWRPHRQIHTLKMVPKMLLLAAAVFVAISSSLVSSSPLTSSLFAIRYALHGFVLGALMFMIAKASSFSFERWAGTITVAGIAYIFLLSAFCLMVPNPANFSWIERIPSATNVRQIGNVVGLMVLAPITLFIFSRSNRIEAVALVATIAFLTFIMWTGTRAALLSVAAAICVAAFMQRDAIKGRKVFLLAASSIVAVSLSLTLPIPAPGFGLLRIADSLGSGDVASGRLQIWADTASAVANSPFFGHGAGTYRENMAALNGYPYNHPHNFILQFLYDWGVIGGGLILALMAGLGLAVISKSGTGRDRRFLAICAYASLLSMALVEGTLFHPLPILLAIALIVPHIAFIRSRIPDER
jgi:O-antigen ligase